MQSRIKSCKNIRLYLIILTMVFDRSRLPWDPGSARKHVILTPPGHFYISIWNNSDLGVREHSGAPKGLQCGKSKYPI